MAAILQTTFAHVYVLQMFEFEMIYQLNLFIRFTLIIVYSSLVWIMDWCSQATSHYLSQHCRTHMSLYDVRRSV